MAPELILTLGTLCLFVAIGLALSIVGVATSERRATARSLAAVAAINAAPQVLLDELEQPFSQRVLAPLGERLAGIGRRITRADTADRIKHRLDIAGNPEGWDVGRVIGLKVVGLVVVLAMGSLVVLPRDWSLSSSLLALLACAALGYALPNILLKNVGDKRESLMRKALPDALDLLTISVEAGLGFDAAVGRVAKNTTGPLSQEFTRLLQEMQLGMGRIEAMRAMGERTSLTDLKSFCLAMVQADQLGIPIGRVLRVQSHEIRVKRRQRAEEAAQKVPVKILFPLIFFILPCLFIVIIGPVVMQMGSFFGSTP